MLFSLLLILIILDKYDSDNKINNKVVLILPKNIVLGLLPLIFDLTLTKLITPSKIKLIINIGLVNNKGKIKEKAKTLSVQASNNLPNSLVTLYLRAIIPSNKSVNPNKHVKTPTNNKLPDKANGIIINGEINLDSVNKLGICLILVSFLPSSLNNSLIFSLK